MTSPAQPEKKELRFKICPACGGVGADANANFWCVNCKGSGEVINYPTPTQEPKEHKHIWKQLRHPLMKVCVVDGCSAYDPAFDEQPSEGWGELDTIVRDYTLIAYPKTKSELRRRIIALLATTRREERERILKDVYGLRKGRIGFDEHDGTDPWNQAIYAVAELLTQKKGT